MRACRLGTAALAVVATTASRSCATAAERSCTTLHLGLLVTGGAREVISHSLAPLTAGGNL